MTAGLARRVAAALWLWVTVCALCLCDNVKRRGGQEEGSGFWNVPGEVARATGRPPARPPSSGVTAAAPADSQSRTPHTHRLTDVFVFDKGEKIKVRSTERAGKRKEDERD